MVIPGDTETPPINIPAAEISSAVRNDGPGVRHHRRRHRRRRGYVKARKYERILRARFQFHLGHADVPVTFRIVWSS